MVAHKIEVATLCELEPSRARSPKRFAFIDRACEFDVPELEGPIERAIHPAPMGNRLRDLLLVSNSNLKFASKFLSKYEVVFFGDGAYVPVQAPRSRDFNHYLYVEQCDVSLCERSRLIGAQYSYFSALLAAHHMRYSARQIEKLYRGEFFETAGRELVKYPSDVRSFVFPVVNWLKNCVVYQGKLYKKIEFVWRVSCFFNDKSKNAKVYFDCVDVPEVTGTDVMTRYFPLQDFDDAVLYRNFLEETFRNDLRFYMGETADIPDKQSVSALIESFGSNFDALHFNVTRTSAAIASYSIKDTYDYLKEEGHVGDLSEISDFSFLASCERRIVESAGGYYSNKGDVEALDLFTRFDDVMSNWRLEQPIYDTLNRNVSKRRNYRYLIHKVLVGLKNEYDHREISLNFGGL